MELSWPVVVMGAIVPGLVFFLLALTAKEKPNITEKWPKVRVWLSVVALFTCGYFLRAAPADTGGEYLHPFGEALMVVAVIGVILEVPHIAEFFQEGLRKALRPRIVLEGKWAYEVKMGTELLTTGTCTITQLGDAVDISGRRKGYRGQKVDMPWRTTFGVISGTTPPMRGFPELHFVFQIMVDSELIEGYCSIPLPKQDPISEMDGKLFQLAPRKERGRIHFERQA